MMGREKLGFHFLPEYEWYNVKKLFPDGALNSVKRAIESRNGKLLGLLSQRRAKKTELVDKVIKIIKNQI